MSVLSDLIIGKPVSEALATCGEFLTLMQSRGEAEPDEDVLGDAIAFAGVSKYPARIKCALLGWMAWKDATAQAMTRRRAQLRQGVTEMDQDTADVTQTELRRQRRRAPTPRTCWRRCATWSTPSSASTWSTSGLVYGLAIGEDGAATIDMTLTSAACPLTDVIEDQAGRRAGRPRARLPDQLGVAAARGARTRSPRTAGSSSAPSASTSERLPASTLVALSVVARRSLSASSSSALPARRG